MPSVHRDRLGAAARRVFHLPRTAIQLVFAALLNGYVVGFAGGKVFKGATKAVCIPVLNCYSCPGALGACPIGALQNALGGEGRHVPFYVLGTLMAFGIVFGRLMCGFVCPFGLVQELLHKIPLPKAHIPRKVDRALRLLKFVMLFGVVVVLSLVVTDELGVTLPFFCEFICPAGTLEAGVPLLLANADLRELAGALFSWKMLVLVAVVVASMLIYRPFCKYLCPLGAFYGLFNRFSFYQMHVDSHACTRCGACAKACPMGVDMPIQPNSAECIRCGKCRAACPQGALVASYEWSLKPGVHPSAGSNEA